MPINNIPGVGPTNADIATAVAAPSAATIATSVAGAVPTIGAINSSVSTYAPSPHAWTLLATITPAYSATSATFTGISGYRTLKIVCPRIEVLTNGTLSGPALRINGDATTNNYSFNGLSVGNNSTIFGGSSMADSLVLSSGFGSSGGSFSGTLYIYNANSSSQKDISSLFGANYGGSGSGMSNLVGSWPGTATVSSLTLQNNGTGLIGGGKSIYLYGAN